MLYVIFDLKFDIQFEKLCEKCSPWKEFKPWHDWLLISHFHPIHRTYNLKLQQHKMINQ
jgi:hypothetical protein